MSERRPKKKDDTWTQEELSSAMRKKEERRVRKESSKLALADGPHSSARYKSERKSAKTGADKRYEEEDGKRHRSKREEKERPSASDRKRTDPRKERDGERRRRDGEDDEEYRREKEKRRREKETRRELESTEKRREERSSRRSDKHYDENGHDRRSEKERRLKDRDDRKHRQRDEDVDTRERRHKERRDDRYSRALDVDQEQEVRRREKKEERRRRKEEERLEDKEKRPRDKDRERSSKLRLNDSESSSKQSSSIRELTSSRSAEHGLDKEDQEDYNYDDEEFEDYEDDFEDDNEGRSESHAGEEEGGSEVSAVIRAIQEENQRVTSARTSSAKSDRDYAVSTESTPSPQVMTTNINFKAAKKSKSKTSQRVLKRRDDLINLIQLDVIAFDLFDLPPVTEYNFYIKNFGSQNSRQISTQCNDDALTVETQTDLPDGVEKWTQNPQEGEVDCGGTTTEPDTNRGEAFLALMREGSNRFGSFITHASSLVDASFAEANIWSGSKPGNRSSLSSCVSCTKFNTNLSYLQGRRILHTVFGDGGIMALSFGMSDREVTTRFDRKGIVTIWKPTNTEQPDKLLICDALPITCCFVPNKNNLLFVGADDGSVLMYDLSEPSTMHQCIEIEKNKTTVFRNPTYTTGWQADVHTSPIVCLNPVGTFQNSNQIFSLGESARICVWTFVEIISDIDDDVGLVPQGRVKLVKSTTIDVTSRKNTSAELGCRTTCAVCPDSSVFYVGTQSGEVLSMSRDHKLKSYRSHGVGEVTSISVSRLSPSLMLVSYNDGRLSLFQIKQEFPTMTWSLNGPVLFCDWSNCRSSVFFALDSSNQLHVWDLMALDSAPVASDAFEHKTLRFCVDRQSSKTTDLMIAYDSCSFEVHRISPHFTDSISADEDEQMMSLVLSFG